MSRNVGGRWAWNVSTKTGADIVVPAIKPRSPAATLRSHSLRRFFFMVCKLGHYQLSMGRHAYLRVVAS